jgi:H+/Cl- antiporter ClcA
MIRIDESMKTLLAMIIGAFTSLGTYVSGSISSFSINMSSIQFLSLEYLYMIITAIFLGMAGALGGLIVRETYKAVCNILFPENSNKKDDDEV